MRKREKNEYPEIEASGRAPKAAQAEQGPRGGGPAGDTPHGGMDSGKKAARGWMRTVIRFSLCLILIGLAMLLAITVGVSGKWKAAVTGEGDEPVRYTVMSGEDLSLYAVEVDCPHMDVRIGVSYRSSCYVSYPHKKGVRLEAQEEDGRLRLWMSDERKWYQKLLPDLFGREEMAVILPYTLFAERDSGYGSVNVSTENGDITVEPYLSLERASLTTVSGDIQMDGRCNQELKLRTDSGKIAVQRAGSRAMTAYSDRGSIAVALGRSEGEVRLRTGKGDILVYGGLAETLYIDAYGGRVQARDLFLADCTVNGVGGDVQLLAFEFRKTLTVSTAGGSVTAEFPTPKKYRVQTLTGHVDLPDASRPGGPVCEITTTSGNVRLRVAE